MFEPARMMRLSAIVLEQDERSVLRELGSLGAVQLTAAVSENMPDLSSRARTEDLAQCDRMLARIAELTRMSGNVDARRMAATSSVSFDEAEEKLRFRENQAGTLVRKREELQRKLQTSADSAAQLADFRELDAPLETHSEFLHFVTGSLPAGALKTIAPQGNILLLPLPALKGRQPIVAATNVPGKAELDEMLRRAGFRPHELPELPTATVSQAFSDAQTSYTIIAAELNQLEESFKSFAEKAAGPLAAIRESVRAERLLLQAQELFVHSESSVLVTGWIPAGMAEAVRDRLTRCTAGKCVVEVVEATGPSGEVPVLLRHSRLLRPFEVLVKAYGLPMYHEIVPTAFVAVSFVVMFGMMFGDVGHGGLLALAGTGLLLASRARNIRDIGVLLICNGLSSIGFGVAYGSYFGIPSMKAHALWRDPLDGDPIGLMRLALAIGVVLMSMGLLLNILNRLRRREFWEGILDKFGIAGVVFYWGALLLLMKSAAIQTLGWSVVVIFAAAISILGWIVKEPVGLLFRRRSGKISSADGMLPAFLESVVGAFEGVLLYVANTISFVRLAAYAMAHAALLMAAFTLAAQVHQTSAGGTVLSLFVIIIGNLVAILLEGVVAAVQGLRLEYYEFFGKFFSGEGQAFKPFTLAPRSTFARTLNPRGIP